ncbi:MAG: hypothetical protein ABGY75_12655 [Gemmataceae bacterium]
MILPAVLVVLLAVAAMGPGRAGGPVPAPPTDAGKDEPSGLKMPDSLQRRHEAFHAEFTKATKEEGKVGDAARAIEKLGTAHFAKANDVFPPLGLLPHLANGKVTPEMREAVEIAEKLRIGLPQIRLDHQELIAGLKKLGEAAKDEGKPDYVRFVEKLTLHIQEEEEVLYPTVLLIGDTVKRGLDKK